jgi:RNA polymerase sigma factor (sigma-70 family)
MEQKELIPHLFRTEYRKIIAVLCKLFGIEHIEIAEDIVSDTFLAASEVWGLKGLPENPTAWLYAVSKNKTKDYLKRNALFIQKISPVIKYISVKSEEVEIDLSVKNINDSQLAMMFTVCHPCISAESQIALSLNLLCGFSVDEIANAFLTNKEVIYKRINRAKEKLQIEKVKIEQPALADIDDRLATVLTTLYLLFNEGYYSASQDEIIRKDLCIEAMRLTLLLQENENTNTPEVNALLALMCFQSSRFDARTNEKGETILYEDQDTNLWNDELISKGAYYLKESSKGDQISKYHYEAAIAFWHTNKNDTKEKWETILQLYNRLLQIEYSPITALNRTYVLAKANGKKIAIVEAEKLDLNDNHLYHSLLGNLYTDVNNIKALEHYQRSFDLSKSAIDKATIMKYINKLQNGLQRESRR